jgi:hypothetical protein
MAASPTGRIWCVLEFGDVIVLWRFNARSDGNLDIVVTNETVNIPLSNGSDIMYFCSVFVKIRFCKILR